MYEDHLIYPLEFEGLKLKPKAITLLCELRSRYKITSIFDADIPEISSAMNWTFTDTRHALQTLEQNKYVRKTQSLSHNRARYKLLKSQYHRRFS